MKLILFLVALIVFPMPLMAETYSWVDEHGTVNFTDDFSRIPRKFRKKSRKLDDASTETTLPSRELNVDTGTKNKLTQDKPDVSATNANGLYGGKKGEVWQQEFRTRAAEVKRLDQQFQQFEGQENKLIGIPRDRAATVSSEFQELRGKYDEAVKRYNELNDAANKAGLPVEFRK